MTYLKTIMVEDGPASKSLFEPIMITRAMEYLALCEDGYDENSKRTRVNIPKQEGLADYLGVSMKTISNWGEKYPPFREVLDALKAKQASRLIDKGLSGEYNSVIVKLLLGHHGYHETQQVDHTSKGDKITKPTETMLKAIKMVEEQLKNEELKTNETWKTSAEKSSTPIPSTPFSETTK